MRRLLLSLLALASFAAAAPAQSFSSQDTVRVRHRHNSRAGTAGGYRGDGRDSWSGHASPPVSLHRGVVRSIDSKTRRLRAGGIPYTEVTPAGGDCPYATGSRLHQCGWRVGTVAYENGRWPAAARRISEMSGRNVQLQQASAGNVFTSWGSGGVVVK